MNKETKKPPLGLEPEWSWRMRMIRKRLTDVISARERYMEVGLEYPSEWDEEEHKLVNELKYWYGHGDGEQLWMKRFYYHSKKSVT